VESRVIEGGQNPEGFTAHTDEENGSRGRDTARPLGKNEGGDVEASPGLVKASTSNTLLA